MIQFFICNFSFFSGELSIEHVNADDGNMEERNLDDAVATKLANNLLKHDRVRMRVLKLNVSVTSENEE